MPPLDPFLARARIAYFSMEIAVRPEMHTYSGGLGILAGDRARSRADLTASLISASVGLMVLHAAIRRSASTAVASAQPAERPR